MPEGNNVREGGNLPPSRCLVIRWGAYGDLLFCLPLLEHLKKKYGYVHLECTPQGKELYSNHPAIDRISTFKVWDFPPEQQSVVADIRWKSLEDAGWDHVVNLWQTLEVGCIAEDHQKEFFWPRERRWEKYGCASFHEAPFLKAGEHIPDLFSCGTFHFPDDILWWMKSWRQRHGDVFNIAIPVRGHIATPQKQPQGLNEIAEEIIASYPDALVWLVGDEHGKSHEFSIGQKKVVRTCGTMSFLQTMAIMKMVDFAFGVESSLLVAAGLFGTPKSALCTASGVRQVTKYHKNDFSIQSTCACSPCHRAVYSPEYCLMEDFGNGLMPSCNGRWDKNKILEGVEFAHKVRGLRRQVDRCEGPGFGSLPDLRALHDLQTDRNEEVRSGILREVQPL